MLSEPFWLGRWVGRGRPDIIVTQPPAEFGGRQSNAESRQAPFRRKPCAHQRKGKPSALADGR
jgi:hypothetical protein